MSSQTQSSVIVRALFAAVVLTLAGCGAAASAPPAAPTAKPAATTIRVLRDDGLLVVYGPFRYGGQFTAHSNAAFDEALRRRDPLSGIRDFEAVDALAAAQGLGLVEDCAMPANNQTLVWRRYGQIGRASCRERV